MPSLASSFSVALVAVVSLVPASVLADVDTMNNINDLCDVNFGSSFDKFVVCLKDGESTTFTTKPNTYLRQAVEHMCCPAANTCMISNSTRSPEVACYDPNTKKSFTNTGSGVCEGTPEACTWVSGINGRISFTNKGVTLYTSVSNGVGVAAGGGGGGSGGNKPSGASLAGVSYAGVLGLSLLGVVVHLL